MENTTVTPERVAFIADAHLGMPGDHPDHEKEVADFLRSIRGKVSHLYIVGDLFDFWFEYGSAVPTIAPHVVFELYNLVREGTSVTMFGGNHDYWLGPYIRHHVGAVTVPDHLVITHQGRKLYMHHGDGHFPRDHGYKALKKILRNRFTIALFRMLHPTVGTWLARVTSKTSRDYLSNEESPRQSAHLLRESARKILSSGEGIDTVIFGHSHVPLIEKTDNGTIVLLGDWIRHNTVVYLENGVFTLHNLKHGDSHDG